VLDEALCVCKHGPRSYTAEDLVELHCHGGRLILQKVLLLTHSLGARLAEPGEFTKRAFLNGRIDLAQAEAVMALIRASGDLSLKQAHYQRQGLFSRRVKELREELTELVAESAAALDYPEEDLAEAAADNLARAAGRLKERVDELLSGGRLGRVIKEGCRAALIGRPNVGKSSLLNSLGGHETAIVTDVPGTTRDSLEEQIFLDGLPLVLFDTAGLRQTEEPVEKIGVEKTRRLMAEAGLLLVVLDGSSPLDDDDRRVLAETREKTALILINKSDLPPVLAREEIAAFAGRAAEDVISVSARTQEGWTLLRERLREKMCGGQNPGEGLYVQEARHRAHLAKASAALAAALTAARELSVDCLLTDLEEAWRELGLITGETAGDELLREIFSRFCLGK
jgi:tRNA modification GTPase